ncbi:MAG: metallophosphoesterase [Clostridia bacterium]|nr:metallophosphoesterase [Clostridia bacterium]
MKILNKNFDEDFRILNLTDTQLSDSEWCEGRWESELLCKTITDLVQRTKPHLITISGDIAWAGHFESYKRLARFLDSFNIPWAPVFGNHDNQGGVDKLNKAAEILLQGGNCLLERGDEDLGWGNYVIGIEQNGVVVHGLVMMDSHDRTEYTDENGNTSLAWGDVIPQQLTWYRERISELSKMGASESTLILHIPLYAYRKAASAAYKQEIDLKAVEPYNEMQRDCFNPGYEDSFGVCYEGIASYPADNGFFDLIKELNHTKTVVCGHDHINSFCIKYEGVRLVYSLKTGCGCYWDKRLNGATLLTVNNQGNLTVEHIFANV